MVFELLENVSLVVLAALAYGALLRLRAATPALRSLAAGALFGAITVLVLVNPIRTPIGATLDARAGPLVFAGFLGGPVGAAVAGILASFARFWVGGPFALAGIIANFCYVAAGCLVRAWTRPDVERPVPFTRIGLLALLSIAAAGAVAVFIRPPSRALDWLQHDFPLVILVNATSCFALGTMIRITNSAHQVSLRLERALERLQLASAAAKIGVWDYDPSEDGARWDATQNMLHGLPAHPQIRQTFEGWKSLVHPEDRERAAKELLTALEGKTNFDTEFRVITPSGEVRHLRAAATVIFDPSGSPKRMVGVNYDVTQLRMNEKALQENREMLLQAQKLEAVGRLSGGIAHDFNNLLSVIVGNLELVLDELDPEDEDRAPLEDAKNAADRGAKLTEQLLAFSRRAPMQPELLDPVEELDALCRLVRRTLPEHVLVEVTAKGPTSRIRIDRAQLQSALLNLAINSKDAMPNGGTLVFDAGDVEVGAEQAALHCSKPGRYVRISVEDEGAGMTKEVRTRAFEPFFTTKEVGRGSGMGLSMVDGFVRQSDGWLRCESEPGRGTRVELYFPAVEGSMAAVHRCETNLVGGSEAILLVEDDSAVRRTFARQLRRLGYRVHEAEGGQLALDILNQGTPIDLLLTDVVMPGMSGPELVNTVRAQWNGIAVVIMSGYAEAGTSGLHGLRRSDLKLQKPVDREELARTIRDALDRNRA